MHLIQVFYRPQHRASMQTLSMLRHILDRREDCALIGIDVSSKEGKKKAMEHNVSKIPLTIVNGEHMIEGVPQSLEEILRAMQWR